MILVMALVAAVAVQRPHVLGVAHMAVYVSDLAKARAFYEDFLGYGEPYHLMDKDGKNERIAFVKINEDQYLELFAEKTREPNTQLNHISFYTDDAEAMRVYLASKGIKVPERVGVGQIKNLNFNVNDPDGHQVEIVQYAKDGWTRRESGKFLPAARISTEMRHVGVTVGELAPALKFYGKILGFTDIWRGPPDGSRLSWVNMQVPDGSSYLELMLYGEPINKRRITFA
jgi:catechol 2,3-dioxygenase-like lactoylglutathione lyase family enzyme